VTSSKDSYLIPVATQNQYDERSAPIGKRFGRMKAEMGFGPEHVFHSIRETVATLLQDAQCPEGIAADIIGRDSHPARVDRESHPLLILTLRRA
jgi:hypothetical protein